jgi:hypothetical protein
MSALGSQEDASRPSLFELIAQEKLREMLQPAVQYVLAVSYSTRLSTGLFGCIGRFLLIIMCFRSMLNDIRDS